MRVVNPNCAGIDVHKKNVKVYLVTRDSAGQRHKYFATVKNSVPEFCCRTTIAK